MSEDLFGGTITSTGASPAAGGSLADTNRQGLPLAVRMRPRTLAEIVGQSHLLAPGSPLRRLAAGEPMSVFLWGPPGTGKTTIAAVVSRQTDSRFVEISAVTAGVKEVRAVLDQARQELRNGRATVLFVDEVHRFSKTQQDVLLPAVENRLVTLIAATTENPSFSVIAPLLSRSLLLTLKPLTDDDISGLLDRGLADERGLAGAYTLADDARATLLRLSGGDARRALTYLEESAAGAAAVDRAEITTEIVEQAVDKAAVRYDRDGDQHYDVISAFIKSIRGSDVQASLHYLARMVAAGEDPRFIARRLVILASEDIGLADPTRPADRDRGGARGELHRHAGGPDQPRPGGDRPGPGPEVQRRHRRDRRRPGRRRGRSDRTGAAASPGRALRGRQDPRARAGLPRTPTTSRTASRPSSTCPTSWSTPATTEPADNGAEVALGGPDAAHRGAAREGSERLSGRAPDRVRSVRSDPRE